MGHFLLKAGCIKGEKAPMNETRGNTRTKPMRENLKEREINSLKDTEKTNVRLKGIYLAAYKAFHPNYNITYQDINGKRDIDGDMLDIDLSEYDYIIATPPCNYWSICNYRRDISKYAQNTKHLLKDIIEKLIIQDKPFIVENVRNFPLMNKEGLFNYPCFIYVIGRHTYWTNIFLNCPDIEQRQDFKQGGKVIKYKDMNNKDHQGGFNVHNVIEEFLNTIGA